jgi:transcriptional regulator with XRE-family HTH domain
MQDIKKEVGSRIRRLRTKKRLSQEEFADLCGIHRGHMGQIERGEKNLTLTTLQKLSKGLDISISTLLKNIS